MEILRARYLRRDEHGEVIETAEAMFERVAKAIAEPARRYGDDVHYWAARFLERLRRLEFLPNSPTLSTCRLAPSHKTRYASDGCSPRSGP